MSDEKHKNQITEEKIVLYWNARKIICWILGILLVPVFLTFLFSMEHKQTLANPQFYKNNLEKSDTYSKLLDEGIPSLIMETKIANDETMNIFAKNAIVYIIKNSLSPEWVQEQTQEAIDAVSEFIRNPKDTSPITIRLENLQQYITQISDGLVIAEQIIPSCEQAQSGGSIAGKLLNVSIDCQSMKMNLDDIRTQISLARKDIDKIAVAELNITNGVKQASHSINIIHNFFYAFKVLIWVSLVLTIFFALLILYIERKNIVVGLKFISFPIVLSSFLTILFAFIMESLDLANVSEKINFNLPDAMQNIIYNFIDVSIIQYFNELKIAAGIFLAIFLVIYILAILAERKIISFEHYKHHKK